MKAKLAELASKKSEAEFGGGFDRVSKQHSSGKLTARERIDLLLDDGSFEEYGIFARCRSSNFGLDKKEAPCDGVITGYGTIFGRPVFVYSQDFTVLGGSLGEMHAKKICEIQKKAMLAGVPIIGISDSGGARIQEGIDALAGYGEIFQNNINASGFIPQISLIMGPCAGGAVYSPALTDFVLMSKGTANMFLTGPSVVKSVLKEDVTAEELGGAIMHAEKSGVADLIFDNDIEVLENTKRLFSFFVLSAGFSSEDAISDDPINRKETLLDSIVPENPNQPYDMHDVITKVVDNRDFFEIKPDFARNLIIGFGRIGGKTIGVVANQPIEKAGCLDIDASVKGARFIRFCDCFNIPIVSFIDVPGFLPGTQQEQGGIIKHGAKLLYAYGEATVPKIAVVTRKSYGGAYIVMSSKHLGADVNYCWPSAEIAVLGADAAGEILFKKHCKTDEEYQNLLDEYKEKFQNAYYAAGRGFIDSIIKPRKTREYIYRALELMKNKKVPLQVAKKHSNCPL